MAFKSVDDRQIIQRAALSSSIGSAVNTTLDSLFSQIDSVMVNLNGTQTLTNKTLAFLKTNTITDSSTTGSSVTIPSGDIADGTVRLTNNSLVSISGITAGSSAQYITLINQTGNSINLLNDDSGATSANRIFTGTGGTLAMPNNASFTLVYDTTSTHWMLTGTAASGSGFTAPTTQSFLQTNYYTFTTTSANATKGAIYTNNGQTFTVVYTIVGATTLVCSATGAPTSSGTLTKSSGTGDATITFSAEINVGTYQLPTSPPPLYIRARLSGGGGGGAGGGTATVNGTAGGTTTFGSSFLTCTGGSGGTSPPVIVSGGVATIVGLNGIAVSGGGGSVAFEGNPPALSPGGNGGNNALGGGGVGGGVNSQDGQNGADNTGAGAGGGANTAGNVFGGGGGGAGGYIDVIIPSPSSTYPFVVGIGGPLGGGNQGDGGIGGSGMIIIDEYYQ